MSLTILFIILLLFNFILTIYTNCPVKCSTCLIEEIACDNGGLNEIPTDLQTGTKKLSFSRQYRFYHTLSQSNFTKLSPPYYDIQSLSIRKSSVKKLTSKTFTSLIYLKNLTLSENHHLKIESSAFYGLNLYILKLDNIGKLMLTKDCFYGLIVNSLSMRSARLQSLDYEMFKPIAKSLNNLYLDNNQIRTIDQKFENLFYRLSIISLSDNPLLCYCPLLWLSKVLQTKILSHTQSNDPNNNYPKCVAPTYLRKRELHKIRESEFNCYIPKIAQIDIDMVSYDSAKMSCKIQPPTSEDNSPVKVYWVDNNDNEYTLPSKSSTSLDITSKQNNLSDQIAVYNLKNYRNGINKNLKCIAENTAGKNTVMVYISWIKLNDEIITTDSSSILINNKLNKNTNYSLNNNKNNFYSNNNNHERNNLKTLNNSYLFQKQYTLLEMTSAVVGTFILTVIFFLIFYKFYFRKRNGYKSGKKELQYTLHNEITRSGLLTGYNNNNMNQSNTINNNNNNNNCSFINNNTLNGKPTFYSYNTNTNTNNTTNRAGGGGVSLGFGLDEASSLSHYSNNSQTYDSIPNHPNIPLPPTQIPIPQSSTTNNNHNTTMMSSPPGYFSTLTNSPSAHFIDYKTHRNLCHPSSPPPNG